MTQEPQQRGMWRSRWAAIGAAVAVTLGGGTGLLTVAAAGEPSVLVNVTPTRVLDTRIDIGLTGPNTTGVGRTLDVTGTIPIVLPGDIAGTALVVPDNATAIVANLTAVAPTAAGFVSIRPGDATGTPTTSNINLASAGGAVPNAITVPIHTDGTVNLYYFGVTPGSTTHLLLDIVGYYQPGGAGTPGPAGPAGAPGVDPAQLVWVAKSGGDFTTLTAAMASITDATANKPYVIKIAPGIYDEAAEIIAKPFVNIEGSGADATTISCTCDGPNGTATIRATGTGGTTITGLTIVNTVTSTVSRSSLVIASSGTDPVTLDGVSVGLTGSAESGASHPALSIASANVVGDDVVVRASGGNVSGVVVNGGVVSFDGLDTRATANFLSTGFQALGSGGHSLRNVFAQATSGFSGVAVGLDLAAPTYVDALTATASGGAFSSGIRTVADVTISNATVTGANTGVTANGSGTVIISESFVTGSESVDRNGVGPVRVANTRVNGNTSGAPTCFNVYTMSFTPYTCI